MAVRFVVSPFLQRVVSKVPCPRVACASGEAVLDDVRYILRKFAYGSTSELEYDPATGEVLLFGVVSYPLGRVFVSICGGRHCVAWYLSIRSINSRGRLFLVCR